MHKDILDASPVIFRMQSVIISVFEQVQSKLLKLGLAYDIDHQTVADCYNFRHHKCMKYSN